MFALFRSVLHARPSLVGETVIQNFLDGVNVDFEDPLEKDSPAVAQLTQLMQVHTHHTHPPYTPTIRTHHAQHTHTLAQAHRGTYICLPVCALPQDNAGVVCGPDLTSARPHRTGAEDSFRHRTAAIANYV